MIPRKNCLAIILLSIYLLAGLQSIGSPLPLEQFQHQHKDFEAVHHEHTFHIGIFHFLGHLLEKISQQDDLTENYIQPAIILTSKNINDKSDKIHYNSTFYLKISDEFEVNINSPPKHYHYLSRSLNTYLFNHPLRGPPSTF